MPLASDFAFDEEKRQILDLWLAPNVVARPFAMPPGVPSDRLTAGRKAFMAMFQDPLFLSDANKSGLVIDPRDSEFMQTLVTRLRALPPNIIEAVRSAADE